MVYYLCYDTPGKMKSERYASPAGINKSEYITDALLNICNNDLQIICLSELLKPGYEKGYYELIGDGCKKIFFTSFKFRNKILSRIGHIFTQIEEIFYLIKNVKKNDTVIVYHSLSSMFLISLVKRMKKCNLIIEVEELYSDVKKNSSLKVKELNYFKIADSYIFITSLLEKKVNVFHKPYAVSHGVYSFNSTVPAKSVNDGKTHIVYAGTLSRIKGGVYNAIKSTMYLDDSFVLHILGKGNAQEETDIKLMVESNNRNNCCKVIFDGYLSGDAFNTFIQSCDIGLSSQPANASFNDSSFPSKILTYLSNGTKVVSVDIPAVKTSDVGDLITYYSVDSPEEIAKAIKKAATSEKQDPRKRLCELDAKFRNDLKKLIY